VKTPYTHALLYAHVNGSIETFEDHGRRIRVGYIQLFDGDSGRAVRWDSQYATSVVFHRELSCLVYSRSSPVPPAMLHLTSLLPLCRQLGPPGCA
jgi:hypothetical protein